MEQPFEESIKLKTSCSFGMKVTAVICEKAQSMTQAA